MLETVKLRNGSEEVKPLVAVTMMSLTSLWNEGLPGMLAVYDLREICEGRGDKVWPQTVEQLKRLALVQPDGSVHDSVRNVVLSALEGEGGNTTLVSPMARPDAPKTTVAAPKNDKA